MATATIHITKLSAARRQIQSALRLFFMEEDELAIHTISAASYSLLKDLKKSSGRSEAADVYRATLFYLVRDFRRGTLPEQMTNDPATMKEIEQIAAQLLPITEDSQLSDVQVTITTANEKNYWNQNNKVANFLKHADRDSNKDFSMDEIDNLLLLMKCCASYIDITSDHLGNEGLIFQAFVTASDPEHKKDGSSFDLIATCIKNLPIKQRKYFCRKVIQKMNEA